MFQFLKQLKNLAPQAARETYLYGERNGVPYKFQAGTIGGSVPAAVVPYVTATEKGNGFVNQTLLTLRALPITMRDTEQGGGAKIYTFPAGRIFRLGGVASIAVTTTSAVASTLNASKTCNWGVGSTTQANATVETTEQDLINVAAFTSSATINVASAAATGVGAAVLAALDGSSSPIDAYLNLAVAGATDIDGDATVTVTGSVLLTWANLGA